MSEAMKRIAVIPARLGGVTLPDKHLILVDGAPMLFYAVEACRDSGVFDDIYINSENEIFGKMAQMLGVKFYKRDPERGGSACSMGNGRQCCVKTRCSVFDHLLFDFMERPGPSHVVLVNPALPLLKSDTIRAFVSMLTQDGYDSLISPQLAAATCHAPAPIVVAADVSSAPAWPAESLQSRAFAIGGWNRTSCLEAYKASHNAQQWDAGDPIHCGKTGMFPLSRIEALSVDTLEDLYMVEACLQHRRQGESPGQFRFTDNIVSIERCAKDVICRDGVKKFEDVGANTRISNIHKIKERMGAPPWDYLFVFSQTDQVGMICQRPGESVRTHAHMTHAEWWMVLEGEFEWRFGDGTVVRAQPFDIITAPRGLVHTIICTSREPGIRLACGARDMEHVYYAT